MSLLLSYNIKARHINFTISKLDTNNTYFTYLRILFQEYFSCSVKSWDSFLTKWSCDLQMESIFVSDIKFTVLI